LIESPDSPPKDKLDQFTVDSQHKVAHMKFYHHLTSPLLCLLTFNQSY
jgi:hypothetical protein